MIKDIYLQRILLIFTIYFVVGLLAIVPLAARSPRSRFTYFSIGFFLMYFAAFMLTPISEILSMIAEMVRDPKYAKDQIEELSRFKQFTIFLGSLFTFVIGGTGINLFTQALTSIPIGDSQSQSRRLSPFAEEYRLFKIFIVILGLLMLVPIALLLIIPRIVR